MKRLIFKSFFFMAAMISLFAQGCDVGYKYDIESGTDEYKADGDNVSIDTSKSIDVSMYDRARIFPGLVDTARERRIADTSVAINLALNYINPSTLGVTASPLPIYSSGLYAGAGELVTIEVDGDVNGLSIQIGSHMDDLTSSGTSLREPVVFTKKALFPGKNYIRNNLGGYIWIIKQSNFTGSSNYKLKFGNVYRAPDFVVGSNMDQLAWGREVQQTTVPWLELRGKHVAFSVSTARMLNKIQGDGNFLTNLEKLINAWDNIVENYYYKYYALTTGSSDLKFRAPEFPERVVLDVQLKDNIYMRWSGQPIVALNTNAMVDDLTNFSSLMAGNSVNILTAIGNNYAMIRTPWWSEVITAGKVIPLFRLTENGFKEHVITKMSDIFLEEGKGINLRFPLALSYAAADSSKWLKNDLETNYDAYALLPLVQLANYKDDNYAFYAKLNKMLKENNFFGGLESFFTELCKYHQVDFSPFFDHWGIDLPDRARTAATQYPLLNKTIWEYDPLSNNPTANIKAYSTKYKYRSDRSNWSVAAFDKNYLNNDQPGSDNQQVQNILDGMKSTYWHTQWRGSVLPLPHYVVIDMKNKQQVDGFFFAYGSRQYRSSRIIVQTTDENDFELEDLSVNWYKIAELRPMSDMGNYSPADGVKPYEGLSKRYTNEQFFEFVTKKNIRYIRLMMPDIDFDGSTHNTMAEFGTYYYK